MHSAYKRMSGYHPRSSEQNRETSVDFTGLARQTKSTKRHKNHFFWNLDGTVRIQRIPESKRSDFSL
jgi:hypothetical protein